MIFTNLEDLLEEIDDIFDDPVFGNISLRGKKEKPDPKCECGAEKVKTTHSDWCPKYEE